MRIGPDWNHYAYTYGEEDRPALIRFDVQCAVLPSPDTHQTTVRVRLEGKSEEFEAGLPELLRGVDCWLVGVMRFADLTVFVFQVEDPGAFEARGATLAGAATGALALESSPGWGFFDERICPNEADWQRITDREQLTRLKEDGSDPTIERAVAHGFFGSPAALAAIQQRLLPEGFTVLSEHGERLEMQRVDRPDEVSAVSVPLARFARAKGAAYDGWKLP